MGAMDKNVFIRCHVVDFKLVKKDKVFGFNKLPVIVFLVARGFMDAIPISKTLISVSSCISLSK